MNHNNFKWLATSSFLLILLALYGLGSRKPQTFKRALYHWKTSFDRGGYSANAQDSFLEAHQVRKLYVKMLDVDYNEANGIIPVSKTQVSFYNPNDSIEYIPVVYITNKVLKKIQPIEIPGFAQKFLLHALRLQTYVPLPIKEVQIDCDWSEDTKEVYFNLIESMKQMMPALKYSATLRMYAFRYPDKMGVPPVNSVMLMLYNLGNAREFSENNSIFNYSEVLKYAKGRKGYVLPMDFALPVFSWTCIYRYNRLIKIVSGIEEGTFNQYKSYLKKVKPNVYLVTQSFSDYLNHGTHYFKPGDVIKIEQSGMIELEQAKQVAIRLGMNNQSTLALFDLDMDELSKFTYEEINKVWRSNF